MKKLVPISTILSWINLVFGSFICLSMLLATSVFGAVVLIMAFFFSAIPLHSYAALQFHKSIRDPSLPLKRQTATGLRFMGFVVLFFGVMIIANSIAILQHTKEWLQMEQSMMPESKQQFNEKTVRLSGVLALLLGLSLTVNVILNFRLLRWYIMSKGNQDNP
ncbi:MAG: hypothetical protein J0H74_35575 [Chitinophagaceae bacterium]|nr:hypothetical protein [Chitinophagaceae bacterium]